MKLLSTRHCAGVLTNRNLQNKTFTLQCYRLPEEKIMNIDALRKKWKDNAEAYKTAEVGSGVLSTDATKRGHFLPSITENYVTSLWNQRRVIRSATVAQRTFYRGR